MSDYVVSLIRTWVPVVVGAAIGWLVSIGVEVPEDQVAAVTALLATVAIGLYYAVVRAIEQKVPWVGLLLGTRKPPTYTTKPAG